MNDLFVVEIHQGLEDASQNTDLKLLEIIIVLPTLEFLSNEVLQRIPIAILHRYVHYPKWKRLVAVLVVLMV